MVRRKVRVLTPPISEVITLEEAKSHLRVDFSDDDAYITSLIKVARSFAEGYQKKSVLPQTLEQTQDWFTAPILLEMGPVTGVTSVKYILENGTEMTVSPTDYILSADDKIYPKKYWPTESLQIVDGVKVTYEAGETFTPETTKQGMLLLIGHWYETREPIVSGQISNVPLSAESLLHMDRRG